MHLMRSLVYIYLVIGILTMTENDLKLLIDNKVVPGCLAHQINSKYQLWIKAKSPAYLMNTRGGVRLFASLDRLNKYLGNLGITKWGVNSNPSEYPDVQ